VKTIGLTGGIGSGKTTAAEILAELGALVIHADAVGHDVYAPGTPGWQAVVDAFGRDIVDTAHGSIDRRKLAAVVFAEPLALKRLNAIVHPLIQQEIQRRIAALRSGGATAPIVVEAAILIEANWVSMVDEVWLLVAPKDCVVERVRSQRRLPTADIEARIAAQLSDAERRRFADVVIENTATREDLRRQLEAAWAHTQ
jgi:dephospho-CoA kinase